MAEPTVGTKYKIASGGIGQGLGSVPAATEVEVTDVLDAGTAGVGDHDEKIVRVEFDEPGQVIDDEGNPQNGTIRRAFSVPVSEFESKFESVN